MQIEQGFYGDFKVTDEFSFDLYALNRTMVTIYWQYNKNIMGWPMTIERNNKTGYWEVYFLNPELEEEDD